MAFPNNASITASNAFNQLRGAATMARAQAVAIRAKSLNGLSASEILKYLSDLRSLYVHMENLSVVPGIADHARTEYANASFDIIAEYNTMVTQIVLTVQWIAANFPKDANGYLLAQTIDVNGVTTDRAFTSGSLAGFRTRLDALIATIAG